MRKQLLDHGYCELIESWGSDEGIIESARMSTGKGFLGWGFGKCQECGLRIDIIGRKDCEVPLNNPDNLQREKCPGCLTERFGLIEWTEGDEKLLKFLYTNKHTTPFEMAGATFEVQAPIMVYREWHRHRTQSYSEMSARYTPLPDTNYVPSVERLMMNSKTNKQAGTIKGAEELTEDAARHYRAELIGHWWAQQELYDRALKSGVPKELARVHLGVGRYSRMRASTDLHNWIGFMRLRCAPGAQWEIRMYANAIREILTDKFPRTMSLFTPPM